MVGQVVEDLGRGEAVALELKLQRHPACGSHRSISAGWTRS